jgi:hypothetical protein
MAALISMNHAKNAKSALKNLFEKLKKQQNLAAAGSSTADADNAATPEAEDGDEEAGEDTPKMKTPARKPTRTTKKAEDNEDVDEEEPAKTAKKTVAKKGAAASKSTAKKGVGKTTAPKKASAGGTKTPGKGKTKGKGKAKAEESEAEAEVETAEVEMVEGDAVTAKAEPEDKDMKDAEFDGKSPNSLTHSTELVAPQTSVPVVASAAAVPDPAEPLAQSAELSIPSVQTTSSAASATPAVGYPANPLIPGAELAFPFFHTFVPPPRRPILADPSKPLHEIIIQGWTYYYTPYDISIAESHGMTLQAYLQWKEYNDYTHINPQPYSMEDAQAQAAARGSGKD